MFLLYGVKARSLSVIFFSHRTVYYFLVFQQGCYCLSNDKCVFRATIHQIKHIYIEWMSIICISQCSLLVDWMRIRTYLNFRYYPFACINHWKLLKVPWTLKTRYETQCYALFSLLIAQVYKLLIAEVKFFRYFFICVCCLFF